MLFFIPGSTYTQISTPMREDVKAGNRLDQEARMTIGNACNHCTEFDAVCTTSSKCERTIALEHFVLSRAYISDLEEVIHYPHAVEPSPFGSLCNKTKGITKVFLAIGPSEVWDL